ncbi:MAG: hypothetical protein P0S95_05135 [Rhabdochlamydiaceae bacterium]|nr:hypothetical protein [Candidatus Amphrikana amoebophyrae]
MTKKSKLPDSLFKASPWSKNSTPIWPLSTFVLHRNLKEKLFPEKLDEKELNKLKNQIKAVLLNSKVLKNPTFLDIDELSQRDREYLYEHFNTLQEMKNFRSGQGFCLDETNNVLITVNFIDHICIHVNDSNSQWDETYKKMNSIDQELNSFLQFAYTEQFGFLTADPSFCGTGLVIESLLHIPLLLQEKKPIEIIHHMDNGIMLASLARNLDFTGDIGIIQNNYTLGTSEDQIIHLLHTNALKLMGLEKELQQKVEEKPSAVIKDKISRAIGTLTSSFQMDTKEALSALSMIKLGIQLNWIKGSDIKEVNKLFFDIQRAHLMQLSDVEPDIKELPEHRSHFLKSTLSNLSLNIK